MSKKFLNIELPLEKSDIISDEEFDHKNLSFGIIKCNKIIPEITIKLTKSKKHAIPMNVALSNTNVFV